MFVVMNIFVFVNVFNILAHVDTLVCIHKFQRIGLIAMSLIFMGYLSSPYTCGC